MYGTIANMRRDQWLRNKRFEHAARIRTDIRRLRGDIAQLETRVKHLEEAAARHDRSPAPED